MNKARLHCKLEKLLPADEVELIYKSIISSKHFDELVDVSVVDGKIKCIITELTPRENLKRAALYYFDSLIPTEVSTYTQLDKSVKSAKHDFDMVVIEAIAEMIKELEELHG